ncbi:hypothetical protein DPMN_026942, partial [Dreissena polymorpha]
MAAEEEYIGTWKIVECVSLAGTVETTGIEGTEFILDESGDVCWKVSDDVEPLPFFNCETYEIVPEKVYSYKAMKFIGTYAGLEVNFKVEISDDLMLLTYEKCCILQCQKISAPDPKDDVPYSFLGALEEGYFSDVIITGDTSKQFHVHSTILNLTAPGIDWTQSTTPLTGLPDDVLAATLHYMYAECLPRGISEDTVKKCVKLVSKLPDLSEFVKLCNIFLQNTALKQQITSLITDLHNRADKIIQLFRGMKLDDSGETESERSANPAKLCYITKQCLREAAIACANLLVVCDLFSRRKAELSREERHDIIKYARARIPVFLKQFHDLLKELGGQLCALNAHQRADFATYLVPEIETALEIFTKYVSNSKSALEQIINVSETERGEKNEKSRKSTVGDVLGKTLKHALHVRELKKLKKLHEKSTTTFFHFMQKKEAFCSMSQSAKIRDITKLFESVGDLVHISQNKVTEFIDCLETKLSMRDWKYLFKLGTSKISWAICKILHNQSMAQPLVKQACDLVHREEFTSAMTSLGLLATEVNPSDQPSTSKGASGAKHTSSVAQKTEYVQLGSVESLCVPPHGRDSRTATQAFKLLQSQHRTDLTFEIIQTHETGDTVVDHTAGGNVEHMGSEVKVDVCSIPAHRVVIATRCHWFKRALLSGMRESIDRKITVHDTSPTLFRMFLEYLYSGSLEMNEMSTEQIADMMTLADRYDTVCLRSKCEYALRHHLDENTVFYLLSLADQLNARTLKENCMLYLSENPLLSTSEVFPDLPEHLQTEVEAVTLSKSHCPINCPDHTVQEVKEGHTVQEGRQTVQVTL